MPQLAIETYFSQYFWLFVILFLFNDFILHKLVPSIGKILKARKEPPIYEKEDIEVKSVNIELPTIKHEYEYKDVLFGVKRLDWINKKKKVKEKIKTKR